MLSAKEIARLQGAGKHRLKQKEFHLLRKLTMAAALYYQSAKRLWTVLPCGFLEFT